MEQDNTLAVVAIIIALIAVAGVAVMFLQEDNTVDLTAISNKIAANSNAISSLGSDLTNTNRDVGRLMSFDIGNDIGSYDEDDFDDFERAIDRNHDDISDIEDCIDDADDFDDLNSC